MNIEERVKEIVKEELINQYQVQEVHSIFQKTDSFYAVSAETTEDPIRRVRDRIEQGIWLPDGDISKLLAAYDDARSECVALRATEENLRMEINNHYARLGRSAGEWDEIERAVDELKELRVKLEEARYDARVWRKVAEGFRAAPFPEAPSLHKTEGVPPILHINTGTQSGVYAKIERHDGSQHFNTLLIPFKHFLSAVKEGEDLVIRFNTEP